MVNQQLLDYIKQQSQQGINNEQIKQPPDFCKLVRHANYV